MKKAIAILLVLVTVFSFAACGGEDVKSDATLKVGCILLENINDGGFTQSMYEGFEAAKTHFDGDVETVYIENVSDSNKQESLKAAEDLIAAGCNVIVGCSYGFGESLGELANSGNHDDVTFLHFSGGMSNDTNFANFFGSMEQAIYLLGMIAGSVTEANKLGYVAAHPFAEVQIGINAFALGAQSVNPDVEVNVVYTGAWGDADKETSAAEQLIAAKCDVLAYYADSAATQIAAEAAGIYCFGWNHPNNVAPNGYLSAAIWNQGEYFIPVFRALIDGTWNPTAVAGTGGTEGYGTGEGEFRYYGGMADGYVDIAEMTDKVPADVQKEVNEVKSKMEAGQFEVFAGPIYYNDGKVLCEAGKSLSTSEIWAISGEVRGVKATSN